MTIRTLPIITLVMVAISSTGCGGMRNFLFGRGASCGLCNRGAVAAPLNPYAVAPFAPVAPRKKWFPGCGLFNRTPAVAPPVACAPICQPPCGSYGYQQSASEQPYYGQPVCGNDCYDGGYQASMPNDCGCGNGYYEGVVSDPYLNGGGAYETVMPDGYNGNAYSGDNFGPRPYQSQKVDSRGDVIIHEDPIPQGARVVN